MGLIRRLLALLLHLIKQQGLDTEVTATQHGERPPAARCSFHGTHAGNNHCSNGGSCIAVPAVHLASSIHMPQAPESHS